MQLLKILNTLCSTASVSGSEDKLLETVSKIISGRLEISTDNIGNIHIKGGCGDKKILLDAHCDQIGFIVTDFCDNGFLRLSGVGGIDVRTLLGARVKIFAKKELVGIFSSVPPHLQKDGDSKGFPSLDNLAVDVGLKLDEAKEIVSRGDIAVIESTPLMLSPNRYCCSALDNKAGCAVMLYVINKLFSENVLKNTCIELILSSQEELGMRGAKAYSSIANFDEIISIDASFAAFPGCPGDSVGVLGKGAMIGHSPVLSKKMTNFLISLSEKLSIPVQHEVMSHSTGTNADALSLMSGDAECALVSIPIRNMHSAAEIVDIRDLESTALLIESYIREVDAR